MRVSSTLISHYHYCMDPNMGKSKLALRHINCACVACTEKLSLAYIAGKIIRTAKICLCNIM